MIRSLSVLGSFLFLPLAATAQQAAPFTADGIIECIASGQEAECIGLGAYQCIDDSADPNSPANFAACFERELVFWEDVLELAFNGMLEVEKALDAENSGLVGRPSGEARLRALQAAWKLWRDATCDYESLLWWEESGDNLSVVPCLMELTGEQTFYLLSLAPSN